MSDQRDPRDKNEVNKIWPMTPTDYEGHYPEPDPPEPIETPLGEQIDGGGEVEE